mmetsp:Transcript_106195/g.194928  ORF Transcript_106195/g.194928 Transcript_106195/m.194928 type:complete len:842 (+) Transcript_106195:61-2586(+)
MLSQRQRSSPAVGGHAMTTGPLSAPGDLSMGHISGDGLAAMKYTAVASDGKTGKAAQLFTTAEQKLDDEEADAALASATEAADAFLSEGDLVGMADSLRLAINAHRLKGQQKEARSLAESKLNVFKDKANKRGQACMLMSLAETTYDKFGTTGRDEAVKKGSEALALFQEVKDQKMEATACMVLSNVHRAIAARLGTSEEFRQARKWASDALDISNNLKDKGGQAKALHALALSCVFEDDFEGGIKHASEAADIYQEQGVKKLLAFEKHCIAMWQLSAQKTDAALETAAAAKALFEELNYGKGYAAAAAGTEVQAYLDKEDGNKALQVAQSALKKAQSAKDLAGEASVQQMLFAYYLSEAENEEALEAAAGALGAIQSVPKDEKSMLWQAEFQRKLARVYSDLHKDDEALTAAEAALNISKTMGDSAEEAISLCCMCEVSMGLKEYETAIEKASEARDMFADDDNCRGEGFALLTLSNVYAAKGEYRRAASAAKTANEVFEDAECPRGQADAVYMAAQLMILEGDFDSAVKFATKGKALSASVKETHSEFQQQLIIAQAQLHMATKEGSPAQLEEPGETWDKALIIAKETVDLARELKSDLRLVEALFHLGQVYVGLGLVDDALDCIDEAMELVEKKKLPHMEGHLELLKAMLYEGQGKRELSLPPLENSLRLLKSVGDENAVARAQDLMDKIVGKEEKEEHIKQMELMMEMQAMLAAGGQTVWTPAAATPMVERTTDDDDAPEIAASAGPVKAYTGPSMDEINAVCSGAALDLIGIEELEVDTPLMDAGLDSLAAVEYGSILAKEFKGMTMPSTLMFDFPSVKSITDFIYTEMRAAQGFD